MTADPERMRRDAAARGKYAPLYRHLLALPTAQAEWRAGFAEVEAVLGFRLPGSARLYRPWWANGGKASGHSHALAWQAAGWRTAQVDLEAERLTFRRAGDGALYRPETEEGEIGRSDPGVEEASPRLPSPWPSGAPGRAWNLDRDFPAWDGGAGDGTWPAGFTASREQIYDDAGRLVGGPGDDRETGPGAGG